MHCAGGIRWSARDADSVESRWNAASLRCSLQQNGEFATDTRRRCRVSVSMSVPLVGEILRSLDLDSKLPENGSMKTTNDIPEDELRDAMRFTKAKTKREAVVKVLEEFNRRRRMAELVKYA